MKHRLALAPTGTATFLRLPPGPYVVRVASGSDAVAEGRIDLPEGAGRRLDLDRR